MSAIATVVDGPAISRAKLRANRRNARLSTGARSEAGKARCRMNAVTHGLFTGDDVVLPGENRAEYEKIRTAIVNSVRPTDDIELALAERMVTARWKLRRVHAMEAGLHEGVARRRVSGRFDAERYAAERLRRDQREAALAEIQARQEQAWREIPPIIDRTNFEEWDNVSRHEQRLENSFSKALRELRQWRAEKRRAADGDEVLEDETSICENEPTVEESVATEAASEACDDASGASRLEGGELIEAVSASDAPDLIRTDPPGSPGSQNASSCSGTSA